MSGRGETSAPEAVHGVVGDATTSVDDMIMDDGEKPPLNPQDICNTIEILIRQQKCQRAREDFLRLFANIHEALQRLR
ncbi:hypothetical protein NPIL_483241 [Nephila pilipes]|uniref:Uncharacterized protein n=1 Tax=Nephila pilipes TaxID=299642 RepID=A0A8X6PGQ9_NEPPI|nr:hypothetical protein NPIL_483241 [Nephila pilipes]